LIPKSIRDAGVIQAASSFTTAPLYYYEQGTTTPAGLIVELVGAAVKHMGLKISYQQIPYTGLIAALNSQKVDVGVGHWGSTPENVAAINVIGTNKSTTGLTSPKVYKKFTDACGARLGATQGSSSAVSDFPILAAACTKANLPAPILSQYQAVTAAIVALQSGRIDGYLGASILGLPYKGLHMNLIGDFPGNVGGFIVQKEATNLGKAFAAALNETIADGAYAKIMAKYDVPKSLWLKKSTLL
jgi:polar amino acid transport system substrate-binding protein